MTVDDTAKILAILTAAYPASYKNMTPEQATGVNNVWAVQFASVPADIVLMAIQKLIATSKFPPSISEVKDKLRSLHWEAFSVINDRMVRAAISPSLLAQYRRIYNETAPYNDTRDFEPPLREMVNGAPFLQTLCGSTHRKEASGNVQA